MKRKALLTEQQLDNMEPKFYGLYAEPGAGKTQTFKDVIVPWADKNNKVVLYLCHRNSLKGQTYNDLKNFIEGLEARFRGTSLKLATYQKIEKFIMHDNVETIVHYDLIVCDEAHYFLADSWNGQTHHSIEYLENMEVPKILMTGTPSYLKFYDDLWNVIILRRPNRDNHNVNKVFIYHKKRQLLCDIKKSHNGDHKVLAFVRGKTSEVRSLADQYNGSFICSKNNDDYEEYADKELFEAVENNIDDLPSDLIFSTSVWNEGINITDSRLRSICSFFPGSINDLVQQVARARMSKVDVSILIPTRKMLTFQKRKNMQELSENPTEPRKIYLLAANREIDEILDVGYMNYLEWFFPKVQLIDMGDVELNEFLESIKGIKMFKSETLSQKSDTLYNIESVKKMTQERFVDTMIGQFNVRGKQNHKSKVGMKVVQKWLNDRSDINYELINGRDRKRKSETYGKSFWMIEERIEVINRKANIGMNETEQETEMENNIKFPYGYVSSRASDGSRIIEKQYYTMEDYERSRISLIGAEEAFKRPRRIKLPNGWLLKIEEEISDFSGAVIVKYAGKVRHVAAAIDGKITHTDPLEGSGYKPEQAIWIIKTQSDIKCLEVEV